MDKKIDNDFFEYVIAYNSLFNMEYTSTIVDFFKPEYFTNNDVKRVLELVFDFYKKRNVLPNLSEIRMFITTDADKEAFKTMLQTFKTLDKKYNIDELYVNTEKFFREKAVYNAILKVSDDYVNNKTQDVTSVYKMFESACNISLVDNIGFDYFEKIDEHIEDLRKIDKTLSTGWKWLDKRINGGFLKNGRALYVFTGFTNVGKSIFLGNITLNLLKENNTVLLITLEMPETIYCKRTSSQLSEIPFSELTNRLDDLKTNIMEFKKNHFNTKLIVKEFPPHTITINHLNAFIQKLKRKNFKFDAIVVDYINLFQPTKSTGKKHEDVQSIAEQLRALSYQYNVPIISASQLNRSSAGVEDPGIEKISESLGLSMTVDAQFSIWTSDEEKAVGIIHMGIQKNRFGPAYGSTTMRINYDNLVVEEIAEENQTSTDDISHVSNALEDLNKKMS